MFNLLGKEEKIKMLTKALRLEVNTEGFYTEIVKDTEDETINQYLNQLVAETKEHARRLSRLLEELQKQ